MGEPGSFSSLMEMIDSHLSKTSLSRSANSEGQPGPSFSLPNICSVRNSNSESLLPPPESVMQLPRFEVKDSDITEVLARQVNNMLKARDNALKDEKQRLVNDLDNMKIRDENNDDYLIDLTASIIKPGQSLSQTKQEEKALTLSNSSSAESLFSEIDDNITKKLQDFEKELLPTCEDMSYILYQRVKKGKCSSFGKVLTAKLRPVAAPYLRTMISHPDVVPFDFSVPSPCDINKERRLQPPADPYAHMNMMERFMAMTKDEIS